MLVLLQSNSRYGCFEIYSEIQISFVLIFWCQQRSVTSLSVRQDAVNAPGSSVADPLWILDYETGGEPFGLQLSAFTLLWTTPVL